MTVGGFDAHPVWLRASTRTGSRDARKAMRQTPSVTCVPVALSVLVVLDYRLLSFWLSTFIGIPLVGFLQHGVRVRDEAVQYRPVA